ncbi:RrF2 family transcriptional regulator [Faecalibacter bovis]|uniref:Rrf2 family transcriptional regulator n=1 Tax=Faecalibacter bovis TaxID=2898187 RepID=A0ABX7XBW5_9FLAO|nr:Rrf2 family transcriptional regulator [Faecalibacter bovis]MBS7333945.1 Rrf2 family transcriptional regulator [Weeksellaceae bacterium]QTV05304.1 Rrf2 family transcriptional regulator [Faecalibacter bovis]
MNNLRFATIVHILVLTEKFKDELITSDFIAGSINVNPVVVRREIQVLKDAEILGSKKGKDGGCFLIKDANEITFGEIYKIITKDMDFAKKNQPNPVCPIGKKMNETLDQLFVSVENNLINQLSKTTLKEFSSQFN